MKKIFFLATFLLSAGSASATQMKVICCDGSVHYFQAVSPTNFYKKYQDLQDTFKYAEALGKIECESCCDGCYQSVSEVKSGTAQVSNSEEDSRLEGTAATSAEGKLDSGLKLT